MQPSTEHLPHQEFINVRCLEQFLVYVMYELATFCHCLWQIVAAMKYVDALLCINHPPSILSQRQETGWDESSKKRR